MLNSLTDSGKAKDILTHTITLQQQTYNQLSSNYHKMRDLTNNISPSLILSIHDQPCLMPNSFLGLSAYPTENRACMNCENCFFGISTYFKENTACFNYNTSITVTYHLRTYDLTYTVYDFNQSQNTLRNFSTTSKYEILDITLTCADMKITINCMPTC